MGLFLGGCAELELPKLNKTKKGETTEEECRKIQKKYNELRSKGYIGNEPSLEKDYTIENAFCEKKYPGYDVNWLDKQMKRIEKMEDYEK